MTLDELAALEARATAGPWESQSEPPGTAVVHEGYVVADTLWPQNRDFVVALRNKGPALIAVARAAQALLDRNRELTQAVGPLTERNAENALWAQRQALVEALAELREA